MPTRVNRLPWQIPRVTIAVQKTCWPDHAQPTTNIINHTPHNAINGYKDQTTGHGFTGR